MMHKRPDQANNRIMNKTIRNFIIDTTLIGLLAASGISGIALWTGVVPRGTVLRQFFKIVHRWGGLGLAILATYHLILHWDWYMRQRLSS